MDYSKSGSLGLVVILYTVDSSLYILKLRVNNKS